LFDLPDTSPTAKVRAQCYEIHSDRWGHILEAGVKSAYVYRLPRRSLPNQSNLGDEFFINVPQQQIGVRRP
jgi:hypothetical protein